MPNPVSDEADRFHDLLSKLARVQKSEIDAEQKRMDAKPKRKRRKPGQIVPAAKKAG